MHLITISANVDTNFAKNLTKANFTLVLDSNLTLNYMGSPIIKPCYFWNCYISWGVVTDVVTKV